MPKKDDRDEPKSSPTEKGGRMPPPLSRDLIAKLQAAVAAERRKRLRTPRADADPEADPETDD